MRRASSCGGAVAGSPSEAQDGGEDDGSLRNGEGTVLGPGGALRAGRGAPRLVRAHPETAKLSERRRHRERPPTP